ncbi:predicted protein [Ostreococcus lucimarinus CCE9901]|uniref:Uncharacterized protein n=1 Tax=Ostreococcus lucimarinus (strain CCE9901) TaxID=436017 RepID=A4RSM7_OSTLU|nr:predicted protein [Ostreococcus lucimarinus CCE9901]ABO94759.1 predicted protein [Ostreococcus lucimarinus CCE9901]|eukprot:XP_001416466.1 predicted protein [Ostreococcus lucimarinus CCE9901]
MRRHQGCKKNKGNRVFCFEHTCGSVFNSAFVLSIHAAVQTPNVTYIQMFSSIHSFESNPLTTRARPHLFSARTAGFEPAQAEPI